jgi:hypothetical protein
MKMVATNIERGGRKQEVDRSKVGSRQAVEHRWATGLDWIDVTVWNTSFPTCNSACVGMRLPILH